MATYSSILACEVPWTGSWRAIVHKGCKELDMTEQLSEHTHTHTRRHTLVSPNGHQHLRNPSLK